MIILVGNGKRYYRTKESSIMRYAIKSEILDCQVEDSRTYTQSHFTWGEGSWETEHTVTTYRKVIEYKLFVSDPERYRELGGQVGAEQCELRGEEPSEYVSFDFMSSLGYITMRKDGLSGEYLYDSQHVSGDKEQYVYERLQRVYSDTDLFLVRTRIITYIYTKEAQTGSTR